MAINTKDATEKQMCTVNLAQIPKIDMTKKRNVMTDDFVTKDKQLAIIVRSVLFLDIIFQFRLNIFN